ncbi:uncharacterized protein LOC107626516 isoform X2 [Arachis ipaensis]|uniref:uncharacterized protein LOC107626516 isoform X2 n=1 Tax=Arachis ipaensis TaxID=130454 RepID=UPI000A2B75B9|nr:uncharacterized protein LOC107626516 isoform X2 [Arachis ipaensis]
MISDKQFIWDKTHDIMIKKIFDHQMVRRLQQMMEDVRERRDHLTIWLHPHIKKALYVYWETDEGFRHCRLTNRANRAFTMSSKLTFMKTKARLSKSLDRDAMMVETFKYTHTLKENKERFANRRSVDHFRLVATTQQFHPTKEDNNNSADAVINSDTVWCETTSKLYKNCVYGMGSFFTNNLCTSILKATSASATSRAVDPEDSNVDLREQVLNLTQSLHQQAQQLQ